MRASTCAEFFISRIDEQAIRWICYGIPNIPPVI